MRRWTSTLIAGLVAWTAVRSAEADIAAAKTAPPGAPPAAPSPELLRAIMDGTLPDDAVLSPVRGNLVVSDFWDDEGPGDRVRRTSLECDAADVRESFREAPEAASRFSCRANGRDWICVGSLHTDSGGARWTTIYFKRDEHDRPLVDMMVFSDKVPFPPKTSALVKAAVARRRPCPAAR